MSGKRIEVSGVTNISSFSSLFLFFPFRMNGGIVLQTFGQDILTPSSMFYYSFILVL